MGRVPTNKRKYEIEHLWEHHEEVMRLLLCGMQPKEISQVVKLTPQQISNIRNSKIFRDRLEIMKAARDADSIDVAKRIQQLAPIAVKRIEEVISRPQEHDPKLVVSASQDILDRAGHGKISRFEGVVGHLRPEDVERIKREAIKVGVETGVVEESVEQSSTKEDESNDEET